MTTEQPMPARASAAAPEAGAALGEAVLLQPSPDGDWACQTTLVRHVRVLRARLEASERALHAALAEAARLPVLRSMLKDADAAVAHGRASSLAQAAALAALQLRLEHCERRRAELMLEAEQQAVQLAVLSERAGVAEQAVAAVQSDNRRLLEERASIFASTSWRLTGIPRRLLMRLRRGLGLRA